MIKLRVVGFSDDLKNLILSSRAQGKRGSHITPIDDRMFDVLEEVWRLRRQSERDEKKAKRTAEVPAESKLAPREVQRLLRAGHSPSDVADMAGVDVGWVERFYGPIAQEKNDVISSVQGLWLEKPKAGASGAPLGDAVEQNLRSRHVRMSEDQLAEAWDATRQDGQAWVVSLEFSFRGRRQRAVWRYEPRGRRLVPANRLAGDIGWVKNGKKATSRKAEPPSRSKATKRPATKAKRRPATKAKRRPATKAKRRPATKARSKAKSRPAKRPKAAPAKRKVRARRPAVRKKAPARRRRPARRSSRRR